MHRAWAACDCATIFDQPRRVFVLGITKFFYQYTLGARDFSSAGPISVKSLRRAGLRPTPKISAAREKNL